MPPLDDEWGVDELFCLMSNVFVCVIAIVSGLLLIDLENVLRFVLLVLFVCLFGQDDVGGVQP